MDADECNNIVRFLESKDDKQRTWLQSVGKSKDKEAQRVYRQRGDCFSHPSTIVFVQNKKGATIVNR